MMKNRLFYSFLSCHFILRISNFIAFALWLFILTIIYYSILVKVQPYFWQEKAICEEQEYVFRCTS